MYKTSPYNRKKEPRRSRFVSAFVTNSLKEFTLITKVSVSLSVKIETLHLPVIEIIQFHA